MKSGWLAALSAATMLTAMPVAAQQLPTSPAEVARPGGTIPGVQKVTLVKVADGVRDPVGVSVAND